MIANKISDLDSCSKIFSIGKATLSNKLEAYYLAANPVRDANITLATVVQDLKKIEAEEASPESALSIFSLLYFNS